jgi:hypothetical protein
MDRTRHAPHRPSSSEEKKGTSSVKHLLIVLLTATLGLGSTVAQASPSSQMSGSNNMPGTMKDESPGTRQPKKKSRKRGKKKVRRTTSSSPGHANR